MFRSLRSQEQYCMRVLPLRSPEQATQTRSGDPIAGALDTIPGKFIRKIAKRN
jgi:hypothetical protein